MTPIQREALQPLADHEFSVDEIVALETLVAADDYAAIAAILSLDANGAPRTRLQSRQVSERGIMSVLGPVHGEVFIAGLETFAASTLPEQHPMAPMHAGIKRMIAWLKTEAGIDIGDPLTHSLLDALVSGGVLNDQSTIAIKALGRVSVTVTAQQVKTALDNVIQPTDWRVEFVALNVDRVNLVPQVQFINSATGETITESVPGNDITFDALKARCAQRLRQLTLRDKAKATFAELQPGVFDPF